MSKKMVISGLIKIQQSRCFIGETKMKNTLTYDLQKAINVNKTVVSYSCSTLTHSFLVRDIVVADLNFVKCLKQALVVRFIKNVTFNKRLNQTYSSAV